ncbi:zinc finger BED domain-containing protein 5-like [Centruroides vittatus]|uniref:zinc finger BED domain-containing protein 5-like n=1 Tax=Centruroides vittatus TaxID=120091 RepID=UPI00350F1804
MNFVKNVNDNALEVSYRVSYRIAQQGEAYTIAEKLIKPCVKDVVTTMIGEEHAKLVDCIPLLDITISRRVKDISNFCASELIRCLQASEHEFTIQFDETTDIAGLVILLVIVRYIHGMAAQEDMLIWKSLPTRTTVEEIFNLIDSYFKRQDISYDLCHQVCTDGAKATLGKLNSIVAHMKQKNPHEKHSLLSSSTSSCSEENARRAKRRT